MNNKTLNLIVGICMVTITGIIIWSTVESRRSMKKGDESIEAFKAALIVHPGDTDDPFSS